MPKSRYIEPLAAIRPAQGVKVTQTAYEDRYTGSIEDLVASGLLSPEQFPGAPGMPVAAILYRVQGANRREGLVSVFKNPGGSFRVCVRVSAKERAHRESSEEKYHGALSRRRPPSVSSGKRLTWDDVNNSRVEASGLVVEDYQPRFMRYIGSSKQLSLAGVLPDSFPGFPKPEDPTKSWCWRRWEEGHLQYNLSKHYVSAEAMRREDATADYWIFDVFDERYHFDAYLDRLAA